jgi:hypothetical protein
MRKWHSSVIENYIRRNDVSKRELYLIFIKIDSLLNFHKSLSRNALIDFYKSLSRNALMCFQKSLSRNALIDFHKSLSRKCVDKFSQIIIARRLIKNDYSISKTTWNWTNLILIINFVKSSIIIWSMKTDNSIHLYAMSITNLLSSYKRIKQLSSLKHD